jgi:hypothetical protein
LAMIATALFKLIFAAFIKAIVLSSTSTIHPPFPCALAL